MPHASPHHREIASNGHFTETYYSGGQIERIPTRDLHPTSQLAPFYIVGAEQVRQSHGDTTAALELTLQIGGNQAQSIAAQAQPGLYFAFEPKNAKETVDALLAVLKPSVEEAQGKITVPVHSDRMGDDRFQTLPKRDVLAGLVDVSRPTEQLVNLLEKRADEAGVPLPPVKAKEVAACYTVQELLASRPGLLTLEELCANQPPMKTRPYTISDFDREKAQIRILVSGVSAELAPGDPLGIKGNGAAREKAGGTATGMLHELATGNDGKPDSDYPINGYLLTEMPRLMFPGMVKKTEAVQHVMKSNPRVAPYLKTFEKVSPDQTLYLLGTGSGMALYMSLLRELSRKQKTGEPPYPAKIVVINGGRYAEDELFGKECRQYVKEGLVAAYHAAASSNGVEKWVTLKDGELQERQVQGYSAKGRYYIQDVLQATYGHHLDKDIREGRAMVYVCGTQGALRGTFSQWPEAFRARPGALQHTASIPSRFFDNFWQGKNQLTHHREPLALPDREKRDARHWTKRVLKIVEIREGKAAWGQAQAIQR